jgi:hypothetical protein
MLAEFRSFDATRVQRQLSRDRLAAVVRAASCALMLAFAAQAPATALGPDRTARILAGLDVPAGGDLRVPTALLERHSKAASHWWNDYERRIGEPLREWAAAEIAPAPGATVFYPFSGPDFPTVQRLFPDASRYVLVSLQRAGPPPALERATAADLGAFFERLGTAWRQFALIGFFRTHDLEAEARRANMRVGVTAALMAFSARLGFEVVAVEPMRVNVYSTDLEVHPGDRSNPATWDSVRLVLAREARRVQLDYVRIDLADAALAAEPARRAWIERMAEQPSVLKAASHLLQRPAFSILRDAILQRAAGVIQDETGIEYGQLAQAFVVTLHGKFTKPYHLFRNDAQRSLAAAYAAGADARPLPFRMSYQRADGANLQVAWRPGPRTADAGVRAAHPKPVQALESHIAAQVASYNVRMRKLFLTRSTTEPRHATYVDAVRNHVSNLLATRGISTRSAALVSLGLAPDGTLHGVQVERNSGNSTFDQRLKDVLQGSKRFPVWPETMRRDADLVIVTLHVPER